MHEQSIVESLLAVALDHAEKAQAAKIRRIFVVVGDLSGVVDESVNFYFNFLSKDNIAAGADLFFTQIAAQLRCRHCDIIFSPEQLNFHCPGCNEEKIEIVGGNELYIESLEVE